MAEAAEERNNGNPKRENHAVGGGGGQIWLVSRGAPSEIRSAGLVAVVRFADDNEAGGGGETRENAPRGFGRRAGPSRAGPPDNEKRPTSSRGARPDAGAGRAGSAANQSAMTPTQRRPRERIASRRPTGRQCCAATRRRTGAPLGHSIVRPRTGRRADDPGGTKREKSEVRSLGQ